MLENENPVFKSLSTKERILQAAKILFAKKGYDATSIKEVSDFAKVNIGAINYHYESKEILYRKIVENHGTHFLEVSARILQPPKSVEEFKLRFQLYIEEILEHDLQNMEEFLIVQREFSLEEPRLLDVLMGSFLPLFQQLVDFLEIAKKKKFLSKEIDPPTVASMLMNHISNTIRGNQLRKKLLNETLDNPKFRKKWTENTLRILLGGVLAE